MAPCLRHAGCAYQRFAEHARALNTEWGSWHDALQRDPEPTQLLSNESRDQRIGPGTEMPVIWNEGTRRRQPRRRLADRPAPRLGADAIEVGGRSFDRGKMNCIDVVGVDEQNGNFNPCRKPREMSKNAALDRRRVDADRIEIVAETRYQIGAHQQLLQVGERPRQQE